METLRELTDAQLDMVAGGFASGAINAVNVVASGSLSLSSSPTAGDAELNIFSFNNVDNSNPGVLVASLVVTAP